MIIEIYYIIEFIVFAIGYYNIFIGHDSLKQLLESLEFTFLLRILNFKQKPTVLTLFTKTIKSIINENQKAKKYIEQTISMAGEIE